VPPYASSCDPLSCCIILLNAPCCGFQVTSNGTAWRLDCDPVARNPGGGAGGPTLWPAELVVLASSTRFAGGGDASTEPWREADAPAWIPLLLRVSIMYISLKHRRVTL
jgi:hypothetical protein